MGVFVQKTLPIYSPMLTKIVVLKDMPKVLKDRVPERPHAAQMG
jgi:ribosomal protein L19